MSRSDSADIKRQLTDRLESLLDAYAPGWIYGQAKRSAFLAPAGKGDNGSFEVYLTGAKRGEWFRRSQGIGGDPVNLIAYLATGDHKAYREGFREAAAFLGLSGDKQAPARAQPRQEAAPEPSREERRAEAFALWLASKAISGTAAERYLRARVRGLGDLTAFTRLRYHPMAKYELARDERFAALVAAVQGPDMRFRGLWRIFLDGAAKAPVKNPKLGMGPCGGGAVWLGEPGPVVNACEGLETGLGVLKLSGGIVACLLSTAGMRGWEPPAFVRSVLIWPDGDRNRIRATEQGERDVPSPGLSAAGALRERLVAVGLECNIQPTPMSGRDYLDAWNEWEAIREGEVVVE